MHKDSSVFSYNIEAISEELHVRGEILTKLIKNFSNTLVQNLFLLDASMAMGDVVQMRAILHVVRGTAGNLRLNRIHDSAQDMHEAVQAAAPQDRISELFKIFRNESLAFIRFAKEL